MSERVIHFSDDHAGTNPDYACRWTHSQHCAASILFPADFLEGKLDCQSALIRKLEAWKAILSLGIDSIMAFMRPNLDSFDALAGENRCEIRALQTLDLANRWIKDTQIKQTLATDMHHLIWVKAIVTDQIKAIPDRLASRSFSDFLDTHGMNVDISNAGIYLLLCRALSITKHRGDDHIDRTDPSLLQSHCKSISKDQCKRFVNHWQKLLSNYSINRLSAWAAQLANAGVPLWMDRFDQDLVLTDDRGRAVYPALSGAQIILKSLSQFHDSPLIIRLNVMHGETYAHTTHLIYKATQKNSRPHFTYHGCGNAALKELGHDTPAFVIEGWAKVASDNLHFCPASHVAQVDIEHIVLSNFSYKSHYPGKNKGAEPRKLVAHLSPIQKTLRTERGCSLCDPSVFCITHISCLRIGEILLTRTPHGLPKLLSSSSFLATPVQISGSKTKASLQSR